MASIHINHLCITLAIAGAALLDSTASGFRYTVGDSIWAIPPSSDFYSGWASSHSFYVNDSLVFEFSMELFNVVQVMRNDYESCNADSSLKVFTVSPAIVELTYKGVFYYICNVSNYCDLGQKVSIVVLPRPPSSAPIPLPSSPSPSGSPPSPPPPPLPSSPPLPSGSPAPPPSSSSSSPLPLPFRSPPPTSSALIPVPSSSPSPPQGVVREPSQAGDSNKSPSPRSGDGSNGVSNSVSNWTGMLCLSGLVVCGILISNIV